MPKEEWGVKRTCPKCSVRFYDLQRDHMKCPSCEDEFTLEELLGNKSRTMQPDKEDAQNADNKVTPEDDEEIVLDDDTDDDLEEDLLVEDDLLEDDEDDDTISLEVVGDVASEDET
jgi:hypothetical protein